VLIASERAEQGVIDCDSGARAPISSSNARKPATPGPVCASNATRPPFAEKQYKLDCARHTSGNSLLLLLLLLLARVYVKVWLARRNMVEVQDRFLTLPALKYHSRASGTRAFEKLERQTKARSTR
jgi:hypothetical protein